MQDNGPSTKLAASKIPDFVGEDKSKVSASKYRSRLRSFLIVTALVVALDQLSKLWVRVNLPQTTRIELWPGFLNLVYVKNTGAIFGLFHSHTELFIALSIAGVISILVFLHYFPPAAVLGAVSFGLILGGAVGNLIDRIHLTYVTDFIDVRLWGNFHWPAFNIADAALTVGLFALIYYFYKSGVFRKPYEHNGKLQN